MAPETQAIALEGRLRRCRNVRTLGVRPAFSDYSEAETALIREARTLYYPSSFYAPLFAAMGKRTFPGPHTYAFAQDKIRQSALFALLGIPHPRSRVFYGKRQMASLHRYFDFPFVAKVPRGSARGQGVWLIRSQDELEGYLRRCPVAYIQEFLHMDRDVRVVVIAGRVVLAYWRIAATGEFRTNLACGGSIRLDPVPDAVVDLARRTARDCGWDDVGIDICLHRGHPMVLEGNMKYGLEGFAAAGIDYDELMERWIEDGRL